MLAQIPRRAGRVLEEVHLACGESDLELVPGEGDIRDLARGTGEVFDRVRVEAGRRAGVAQSSSQSSLGHRPGLDILRAAPEELT